MGGSNRFKVWLQAIRIPFLPAAGLPVLVGTALAWYEKKQFDPLLFFMCLFGVLALHAGANLFNDYFDYKSGNDRVNEYGQLPFSGGTGVILKGLLTEEEIWHGAVTTYVIGALVGLYLALRCGFFILFLGACGILSGYFYVGEPFKLAYRGWGEVLVGLNFGLLIVVGSYYVQVRDISQLVLIASAPLTLLIAAVLYVNQFPDYEADKTVGKANLVVRLGRRKALTGYQILIALAYITLVLGVVIGGMPPIILLAGLTLPLGVRSCRILGCFYDKPGELVEASASIMKANFLTGSIMALGFTMMGFF